jgi:pyrimidine-nucleoside phosphorylase
LPLFRAVDIIRKKRDGQALPADEIESFVAGVTAGDWPDYQAAALLMAILLRGMDAEETAVLTRAMACSGVRLDLSDIPGPKIDKHSTGGVGDKTSLIVAPLAAACGVVVPMMSGRGLGHTGGTLDKLEAIPGFRVALSLPDMRAALGQVGCVMIGQTPKIAPADRLLYALRDVTATVESIPLITASIMSKKIAEGIGGLVLDVKCGTGAFMKNRQDAEALARSLIQSGQKNGVRTRALLTAMDEPLGRAVGNALEVHECLQTLRGQGPADLEMLSVELAARMVYLGGQAASLPEAVGKVRQALASGAGLEKFRQIISRQGGDVRALDQPERLPAASRRWLLRAVGPGFVAAIDAEKVGRASMVLGAGRDRVHDAIDHAVGIVIQARRGDEVRAGDALAEVYYSDEAKLGKAKPLLDHAWIILAAKPAQASVLLGEVMESSHDGKPS